LITKFVWLVVELGNERPRKRGMNQPWSKQEKETGRGAKGPERGVWYSSSQGRGGKNGEEKKYKGKLWLRGYGYWAF